MSLKCRGSAAGARRRGGALCDAPPLRQEGEAAARDGEAEAREGEAEALEGEAEAREGKAEAREGDTAARLSALDVILPAATAAPRASGIHSSLWTTRTPPRLMMSTERAGPPPWASSPWGKEKRAGCIQPMGKRKAGWLHPAHGEKKSGLVASSP